VRPVVPVQDSLLETAASNTTTAQTFRIVRRNAKKQSRKQRVRGKRGAIPINTPA